MPTSKRIGREGLLRAGADVLNEARDVVRRCLTIDRVADRAGVSRQALQYHWRDFDRYVEDLMPYVLHQEQFRSVAVIPDALRELANSTDVLADLRAFLRADFEVVRDDEAFGMQLMIMGGSPDREVRTGLKHLYRQFDAKLIPAIEDLLDRWQREPVFPYTVQSLAVMFNGLIEGLAMRSRFDPERATPDLYLNTAMCLIVMTTQTRGAQVQIANRLAEIDTWPRPSA
jgi:AcrR family transcriptional regulator